MAQSLQIIRLRHVDAALALVGLDQYGDNIFIVNGNLRHGFKIIVGGQRNR